MILSNTGVLFDALLRNISSTVFTEKEREKVIEDVKKDLEELKQIDKESKRDKSDWIQSTAEADEARKRASEKAVMEALISKSIRNVRGDSMLSLAPRGRARTFVVPHKPKCKSTSNFAERVQVTCDETSKYRSIDGYCNNLNNPAQGAAGIPMRRLTNTAYADG